MRKQLSDNHKKSLEVLRNKLDSRVISALNSCVSCGLCAESCHYYLAEKDPDYIPGKKIALISAIYRRYFTMSGKVLKGFVGARDYDDKTTEELKDMVFGRCSMCGRCTMHCSIGVDIALLVRTARSMLFSMGEVSKGLMSTANAALNSGNNMNIPEDELIDTLKWLEEDLQLEVNDPNARIPLNETGAEIVYTLNPREPKFFPLSISAVAKIFYAAKASWTLSTKTYDVTNYSYFAGDEEGAKTLTQRMYDEVNHLGGKTLALAECGHGFRAFRWEGPQWLGKKYNYDATSILEIIAQYIKDGKIRLDLSKNQKTTTLHDPCNLVRNGGIIEEQRFILNNSVANFVEMYPNRANNYCCGGGGAQLAMGEYSERRVKAGSIKAGQIRKTGAKVVATPCHNCIDQLMELNKVYELNIEIKTISEIVADALIL